jgi:hypothetical protein
MKKPHTLTDRERNLIAIYSQCQLGMTPKQFYVKWGVSYEQIASICSRSDSTVQGWFKREKSKISYCCRFAPFGSNGFSAGTL